MDAMDCIICLFIIGVAGVFIYVTFSNWDNENNAVDEFYIVVGKTYGYSGVEICVLEDDSNKRIQSGKDNGCNYDIGDIVLVHVSKNGNSIKQLIEAVNHQ